LAIPQASSISTSGTIWRSDRNFARARASRCRPGIISGSWSSTHALVGDWYNHADYATAFLIGLLLARQPRVWSDMERQRWMALTAAVGCFAAFMLLRSDVGAATSWLPPKWCVSAAYGCYQWLAMAAVLGQAKCWFTADGPLRRYLTEAIFPYYIVHQTAIIMIAHALRDSGLSSGMEASIVIGGTALTCAATYEIARRINLVRPLFGLRMAGEERSGRLGSSRPDTSGPDMPRCKSC
jgi:hypothetical protein